MLSCDSKMIPRAFLFCINSVVDMIYELFQAPSYL